MTTLKITQTDYKNRTIILENIDTFQRLENNSGEAFITFGNYIVSLNPTSADLVEKILNHRSYSTIYK